MSKRRGKKKLKGHADSGTGCKCPYCGSRNTRAIKKPRGAG
ncbi:MAG: hypothetical protein V3V91_04500 [Thermoplasmata archaeon]